MMTTFTKVALLTVSVLLVGLLLAPGSAYAVMIPIASSSSSSDFSGSFAVGASHDGATNEAATGGGHTFTYWLAVTGVTDAQNTYALDLTGAPDGWTVDSLSILNTKNSGFEDRATDNFTIQVSTDGGFTFGDGTTMGADLVSDSLQIYTAGFQSESSFLPVSGVTHVRFTAVDFMSGDGTGPGTGAGLNEFEIFGLATPPVPEPSTFLLLGLGTLGLVRHTRRHRRRA
jgi:hypothetical protein